MAVEKWRLANDAARAAFRDDVNRKNEQVITSTVDMRFPTRQFDDSHHVPTFVQSCVQRFSDELEVKKDDVYQVYWVDCTVPGYLVQRSLMATFSILAGQLSAAPTKSVAIIFAPNTGTFGEEYDEAGINKMCEEVEQQLKDPEWQLCYRTATLVFDEETMPQQARRPGWHRMWICVSDQKELDPATGKEKFKSAFVNSRLWMRSVVSQVPMLAIKDMVNPTKRLNTGMQNNSKSARRKQWVAGWRAAQSIKSLLWKGMPVTSDNVAAFISLYGYDVSLPESVMRGGSTTTPREMVITTVFADIDADIDKPNVLIEKWVRSTTKRLMTQLVEEPGGGDLQP